MFSSTNKPPHFVTITISLILALFITMQPISEASENVDINSCSTAIQNSDQRIAFTPEFGEKNDWEQDYTRYKTRYWSKVNRSGYISQFISRAYNLLPGTWHLAVWATKTWLQKLLSKTGEPALFTQDVLATEEFLSKDIRKKLESLDMEVKQLNAKIPSLQKEISEVAASKSEERFVLMHVLKRDLKKAISSLEKKQQTLKDGKKTIANFIDTYTEHGQHLVNKQKRINDFFDKALTAEIQISALKNALENFPTPRPIKKVLHDLLSLQFIKSKKSNSDNIKKMGKIVIWLPIVKDGVVIPSKHSVIVFHRSDIRYHLRKFKHKRKQYFGSALQSFQGLFGWKLKQLEAEYAIDKRRVEIVVRRIQVHKNHTDDQDDLLHSLANSLAEAKTSPFIRIRSHLASLLLRAEIKNRIDGLDEAFVNSSFSQSTSDLLGPDGMKTMQSAAKIPSFSPSGVIKYGKQIVVSTVALATFGVASGYFKDEIVSATEAAIASTTEKGQSMYYGVKYRVFAKEQWIDDLFYWGEKKDNFKPDKEFNLYIRENYSDVLQAIDYARDNDTKLPRDLSGRLDEYTYLLSYFTMWKYDLAKKAQQDAKQVLIEKKAEEKVQDILKKFYDDIVAAQMQLVSVARAPETNEFLDRLEQILQTTEDPNLNESSIHQIITQVESELSVQQVWSEEMNLAPATLEKLSTLLEYRVAIENYYFDITTRMNRSSYSRATPQPGQKIKFTPLRKDQIKRYDEFVRDLVAMKSGAIYNLTLIKAPLRKAN